MVLVDTNIWINHFQKTNHELVDLLATGSVVCHPFIVGELACGNLQNRQEILTLFEALPTVTVADSREFFAFVEMRKLAGKGLGFVDVHILASAVLAQVRLWTADKRMAGVARDLGLKY